MAAPRIKICGITSAQDLEAVIAARADYAGMIFYPPSPRHLSPAQAGALSQQADGRIGRVGLFVDATDNEIAAVLAEAKLDALQFQGNETPGRVAQLRSQFGVPIWKAISVASAADVARASAYQDAADLILFDAKTPKGSLPGGMGLSFDWELVKNYRGQLPWGLAGGLSPENVATALRQTGAPLVDVCSGTEGAPGVKDVDKIAAFCKAARNLQDAR